MFQVTKLQNCKSLDILRRPQNFVPSSTYNLTLLKVSKSRKQNTKFSHTPKNQRNIVHFFALASKSGCIKKIKSSLKC